MSSNDWSVWDYVKVTAMASLAVGLVVVIRMLPTWLT